MFKKAFFKKTVKSAFTVTGILMTWAVILHLNLMESLKVLAHLHKGNWTSFSVVLVLGQKTVFRLPLCGEHN